MINNAVEQELNKAPKRICKRCLIRDMDQSEYFDDLHQYIKNIDASLKVSDELYEERLTLCTSCDLLADGMCRACGCFVELRAVMKKNSCPYEKWKKTE